jgi:hypothetical protein
LRCFADILCNVGRIASTAAWVSQKYLAERPESLFTGNFSKGDIFKADVLAASDVWSSISSASALLDQPVVEELVVYKTTPSIPDLRGWFGRAVAIEPAWGKHLLVAATQLATTFVHDLKAITPAYAHFVTDEKLTQALIKKHLLDHRFRQPLTEKTVALAHVARLAKGLQAEWGGSPMEGEEIALVDEDLTGWEMALTAAKQALEVIAGCTVLFESSGPKQIEEAKRLTAKDRPNMPKALWNALMRVGEYQAQAQVVMTKVQAKAEL